MRSSTLAFLLCLALLFSCRKTEPVQTASGHPAADHPALANQNQSPDYHGLIREYESMIAEDPKDLAALVGLGNIYFDMGQWRPAVAMYEHALALDPRNADVHTDRGTALRNLGLPDQALAEYRHALDLEPGHLDARYNMGVVLAYDKKDIRAATHVWNELLKLAPTYRNAQLIHQHIEALTHGKQKAAP